MDCEQVLAQNGFTNLGCKQSNHPNSAWGALLSFLSITKGLFALPFSSTLCMQYPLSKYFNYKVSVAKLKRCKIVLIVHDVKSLMGKNTDPAQEMKRFNKADVLILHNHAMIEWFKANGCTTTMVPLYLFDYLLSPNQSLSDVPKNFENDIIFAGGLGIEKSAFLYQLDDLEKSDYRLKLYGNGFQKEKVSKNSILAYQGVFAPDEVLDHLKGNFGLVWNGNDIKECDGAFGKYIQYNNPHKTSLYLLAGLPIIIWDKAAVAPLVEKEGIGFTISSLHELPEKLAKLDATAYATMVTKVDETRKKIADGYFLKEAVQKALRQLDQRKS